MQELARHIRSVYLILMLTSASVLAGLLYVPPDWRAFRADVNALWKMKNFSTAFDQFLQFSVEQFGYDPVLRFAGSSGGITKLRIYFLFGNFGDTNSDKELIRKAIRGIRPSKDSILEISELWNQINAEWYVLDTSKSPKLWILPETDGTHFEYPHGLGKPLLATADAAQFLVDNNLSLARFRPCGTGLFSFENQKYLQQLAKLMMERGCKQPFARQFDNANWIHGYALVVNDSLLRNRIGDDLFADKLDGDIDIQERLDSLQKSTIAFSQYSQYRAGKGASIKNGYAIIEVPVREISSHLYERISARAASSPEERLGRKFASAFPNLESRFAEGRVRFMSLDELREYSQELQSGGQDGLTMPVVNVQVKTSQFALWASIFVVALLTYVAALVSQFKSATTSVGLAKEDELVCLYWFGFSGGAGNRSLLIASLLVPVSVIAVSALEQMSSPDSYFFLSLFLLVWAIVCAGIVLKRSKIRIMAGP